MRLAPLPLLALALATTGCSTLGLTQSLDPQVEEVRSMHEQLSADWEAIGAQLDGVESDLVAFGNQRINTDKFDPAVVREAVNTIDLPEEADVDDVALTTKQAEARLAAYEQNLEQLDLEVRGTLEEMRTTGARLSKQLYTEIPASLADIGTRTAGLSVQLAQIMGEAEQMEAVAEKNPLMSDADDLELEQDQVELDQEIDALKSLAERIAGESKGYADRLSAATAKFNLELSSFTD